MLAPCTHKVKADHDRPESDEARWALRGFRVVHVFDVSQTDGEPLPSLAAPLLEGEAPEALWDGLATQVEAAGFSIERGACAGANGRTDFLRHVVRARTDVDAAQAAKTLAHELAHLLLDHGTSSCRGRAEVEAESVAFLVCAGAGMETGSYTFPYVTVWAGGDAEVVRATAARVMTNARAILATAGLASEEARQFEAT